MKFLKLKEGKGQVNELHLQYSKPFFLIHPEVYNNLTDETGSNSPLINHIKA